VNLSEFLTRLLTDGLVLVPRHMAVFQEDDLQASALLLKQLYDTDCFEMPYQAPAFEPEAALWAARYLFYATQLVLLRDQDEAAMDQYLQPFPGQQSAGVIYSVDLVFRYLGNLFKLSSGIAPNDPLVIYLRQTAAQWPFSSVGLNIEPATDTAVILEHPSLKYTYVDRIILRTDVSRLNGIKEQQTLKEILGIHQAKLWPGLELPALPHQQTL
jgi:hypothetical protein